MTYETTIIWTLLPNGLPEGGTPRVTVFITPRLATTNPAETVITLHDFPMFVNWPEVLSGLKFEIESENGLHKTNIADLQADPALWARFFNEKTLVVPYKEPQLYNSLILSYPVSTIAEYLQNQYQAMGIQITSELPTIFPKPGMEGTSGLHTYIGDLKDLLTADKKNKFEAYVKRSDKPPAILSDTGPEGFSSIQTDFYKLKRFYDRTEKPYQIPPLHPSTNPPQPAEPIPVPEFDFHKTIGALGDYEILMRRLGLVFDLVLDSSELSSNSWISLHVTGINDVERASVTPRTRYFYAPNEVFVAESKTDKDELVGPNLLRLMGTREIGLPASPQAANKSLYGLIQFDLDGAALKYINFISTMYPSFAHEVNDQAGFPSLRSSGIELIRRDRANKLLDRFNNDMHMNMNLSSGQIELYAQDLIRGYRIDVFDEGLGNWYSLCSRLGHYRFLDETGNIKDEFKDVDEGYVKAGSATSRDPDTNKLYYHESLFGWTGWSLVAPRPSKTIVDPAHRDPLADSDDPETLVAPLRNVTIPGTGFDVNFMPMPGSLPRLRFGNSYRLRARAVGLAANSATMEEADKFAGNEGVTDSITYLRFDPIITPFLVARRDTTEPKPDGETSERIIIRSNYDQKVSDYVASRGQYGYKLTSERHVVPPKTSQTMSEFHGLFDAALGKERDYELWFNIAKRESEPVSEKWVSINDIQAEPSKVDPLGNAEEFVAPEEQLTVRYLPDVLARGMTLFGDPLDSLQADVLAPDVEVIELVHPIEDKFKILKIAFAGEWPDIQPFRLRLAAPNDLALEPGQLVGQSSNFHWSSEKRVLTVFLEKAEIIRLKYSSYMYPEDLDLMGIWNWLKQTSSYGQGLFWEKYAEHGIHWMLTPYSDLTLVHAVQQPLETPEITQLSEYLSREKGSLSLKANMDVTLNVPSSGKLELLATWNEVADNPAASEPPLDFKYIKQEEVKDWLITEQDSSPKRDVEFEHFFGDTKYRHVEYRLRATSRFTEYFTPSITNDIANITRESTQPSAYDVLSTARPIAPKLLYMLPLFEWAERVNEGIHPLSESPVIPTTSTSEARSWTSLTRERKGNSFRIYIERPWFSSGAGEQLGIVLWTASRNTTNVENYVSQRGQDPIWKHDSDLWGSPYANRLTVNDFLGATKIVENVKLAEDPQYSVTVLGFTPEYDRTRGLWYCDIVLSEERNTSYFPFLRLALVRYQENTISDSQEDLRISRVILSDFFQLTPTRNLNVVIQSDHSVVVTLIGISGKSSYIPKVAEYEEARGYNLVEVTVEEFDPTIGGDLAWQPILSPTGRPSSTTLLIPHQLTPDQPLTVWKGEINLPEARTTKTYRLVIREYEQFEPDKRSSAALNKRLVYADIVLL